MFQENLVEEVNRFTTDIHPFFDKTRLQPGYVWDEKLMASVVDSAVLVPVLSPRFFESDYCQREVNAFVDAHGLGSASAYRSRIMPVQLLSTAPADHVLAKVQATIFSRKGDDGVPFEFRPGTPEYGDALRKLAYAIAQVLIALPPQRQGRAAVYLATDFKPASDKLRASLLHHFDVLPGEPMSLLGLGDGELQESLEQDFARCFASIHPLGNAPMAKPLIDAQIAFAKRANKPRLVWTPDRPDHLTNDGFEWFTNAAEIEDRIRRLHEKPPAAAKPSTSEGRLIYFLCPDRNNRLHAEPLRGELKKRGVHTYLSPLDGPADQVMQEHVNLLDELDGCLIYYGDVDRSWFDGIFPRLRKKIRQRGLRTVIYSAPPPNDHKLDLRYQEWTVVEDADAAARALLEGAA